MELSFYGDRRFSLRFPRAVETDGILSEVICRSASMTLPCSKDTENCAVLWYDAAGTRTLEECLRCAALNVTAMQQILLDLAVTLETLVLNGFTQETILMQPDQVFVSLSDGRPRFVCIPVAAGSLEESEDDSQNGFASFFRQLVLLAHSTDAYSLIALVLEETASAADAGRFHLPRFISRLKGFDASSNGSIVRRSPWIAGAKALLTGGIMCGFMELGFRLVADRFFIPYENVAIGAVLLVSVLTAVIEWLTAWRGKRTEIKKAVPVNYLLLPMVRSSSGKRASLPQRISMRQAEANAVVHSGVIDFDGKRSMGFQSDDPGESAADNSPGSSVWEHTISENTIHEDRPFYACLVPLDGNRQTVTLAKERFVIGKDNQCDLVIPVETVSRRHAEIILRQGLFYIEDHSLNGTFVNGRRIPQGKTAQIHNGDVIAFNREKYRFATMDGRETKQ